MLRKRSKFNTTLSVAVMPVLVLLMTGVSWGFSGSPPDGMANDPPANTNCTQCHSSFALNSGPGMLTMVNLPAEYEPGLSYIVTVNLEHIGQTIWGFETTAILANGDRAGTLLPLDAQVLISSAGGNEREYAKHTTAGNQRGSASASWDFEWTTPPAQSGPVDFYMTGNAGNWDGSTSDDYIYAISANVPEQIVGVADRPAALPETPVLMTAYPNPFNPEITLNLASLPAGEVTVEVMNIQGEILRDLNFASASTGPMNVPLDLIDLPSGNYIVRASYRGGVSILQLTKLK